MKSALQKYYEGELTYLHEAGLAFARQYKKIASRLALGPNGSEDPHVERLLEGVALLTARIRRKIDDELPEVTDSLLGILYPHFLSPIPSMGVVQFNLDEGMSQPTDGHEIARGTELRTRPVEDVPLRFRTAYPVHLWPLAIEDAGLERQVSVAPLESRREFRARAVLRVRLRATAGTSFAEVGPPALRMHLHGESALTYGLYELLCGGPIQAELHVPGRKGPGTGVLLAQPAIRPVGFASDEMLVPYPSNAFHGYALLDEYFCFPQKFLFFDVHGLDRAREIGAEKEVELRVFCGRTPRFNQEVRATAFQLGCTPIVSLFEQPARPITADHTKAEYLVVPEVDHPKAYETYSIDSVIAVGGEAEGQRTFRPFYALRHGAHDDGRLAFWHMTRRETPDGANETYVSLVDDALRPTSPAFETLSLKLTCTNRVVENDVRFSGQPGDFDQIMPFARLQGLEGPSPTRHRPPGRRAHWRLVSHLALNYLSLTDLADREPKEQEHGADPLRAMLELYDPTGSDAVRWQIEGIRDVRGKRLPRMVNGALCRGVRVTIDFDRDHFVGSSPYLLAAVLDRFLALYASINSFTQLVARMASDEEPHTWPPRAGEHLLV